MKQRIWKRRLLAFLLAVAMLCTTMLPAFASETRPLVYDPAILEQLTEIAGDASKSPEEKLTQLIEMGLITQQDIDEAKQDTVSDAEASAGALRNGMRTLNIDGRKMTLDDIREMLAQPDIDLSQKVNIDGITVTFGNLKTMVEIEDQIQKIAASFIDPEALEPEFKTAYNAILSQMRTEGITLADDSISLLPKPGDGTSVAYDHDVCIQLENDGVYEVTTGDREVKLTFTLSKPLPYAVSFDYRTADGNAAAGINYTEKSGTVVFESNQTEQNVTIALAENDTLIETTPIEWWGKNKTFLVELSNAKNALFENGFRDASVRVEINSEYEYSSSNAFTRGEAVVSWAEGRKEDGSVWPAGSLTLSKGQTAATHPNGEDGGRRIPSKEFTAKYPVEITQDPEELKKLQNEIDNGSFDALKVDMHRGYADNGTWEQWGIDAKSAKVSTAKGETIANMAVECHPENQDPESGSSSVYIPLEKQWKQDVFHWGSFMIEHTVKYNRGNDLHVNGAYFVNAFPPMVKEVAVPDGTYYPGQLIPVTVTYDSPVFSRDSGPALAEINGTEVISAKQQDGYYDSKGLANKLTYLYEVQENDLPYVAVTSISKARDSAQNTMEPDTTNREFTNAKISMPREKAIVSIRTDQDQYSPAGEEGYIEIGLDTHHSKWLEDSGTEAVKVSIDGGATLYDVDYKRDASGTAFDDTLITTVPVKFPANADEQAKSVRAELFLEDTDAEGHHSLVMGIYHDVNIRAAQYPTAVSIDPDCYPKDNITYFRNPPVMKAVTEPAADTLDPSPVFNWSSNNPDIAGIDPKTGEIQPKTEGTVTFTVTAKGKDGAVLTDTTQVITVMDGGEPFLEAPGQITTSIQTDTTVAWSTNVISKNSKKNPAVDTVFAIKVVDTDSGQEVHQETVTTNAEESKTAVLIPGGVLTKISSSGKSAYQVIITCADPVYESETLTAQSDIVTRALPVVVRLEGVENYYMTDENPHVSFEAVFQNGDTQNGLEYDYKVLKNGRPFNNHAQTGAGYKDTSKSFSFDADKVDDSSLRDIYIVSIEANNPGDSPSTDSFILYVYRSGSLDISVDGDGEDNLTLNNNTKRDIAKTTTDDISGLRERANLKSMLSIHRDGLEWSNVDDQVAWKSSADNVASLNYQQNGFWANINDYDYTSYRPSSEFMLVGHSDGSAAIKATHAKTGEETTVDVTVTTLKDKLYVFNFLPRQRTEVKYTNGKGEKKTLSTNDQGEIAIYEEHGIASNIELTSGEGEDLYMGTLYNQKLVSSEGNPSKMELYPVNTFKLKPAAKIELYLVTENGGTYEGELSISGAVYKNNKICPETEIRDREMTLTAEDQGRLVISDMNPDDFWTEEDGETLTPSDQMDYVFIARTPNDEYYPLYIKVDGSLSADESVVFTANAMTVEKVPAGSENKPFIAAMSARFNNVSSKWSPVLNYHDILGISELTPKMELNTTVLWWGEKNAYNADYTVQMEDEYGKLLNNQKTSDITRYPFSDIAVSENNIVLSEGNPDLEAGGTARPRVKLKKSGQLVLAQDTSFTFMNGIGLPDIESDAGLQDALDNMLDDSYKTDTSSDKYSEGGDMVAPGTKNLLSSLDATFNDLGLDMLLSPTNNPTVWKFFIEIGGDFMGDSKSENNIMIDQTADKTNFLPGPLDAYRMIKGTYKENEMNNFKDAIRTGTGKEASYGAKLGGFYEGIITYKNGKWEMQTRSGGFTYGGAGGYTWSVNTLVGPIPITASASIGGGLEMDHKILMTEHGSGDNKEYLQNLLVTMRINAYIKAFVGIGFDLSVLALKFGVFGQVDLSNYNMFLDYRDDSGKLHSIHGQKVDFTGKVGIEFYLKILFVKYRKILASTSFTAGKTFNDWDEIVKWQEEANFPSDFGGYDTDTAAMMMALASMPEFETLAEGMYIEDRNYLKLADRTWGEPDGGIQLMSFDDQNKLENLQSNSYPYANPLVSNDGNMVVFLSDASSEDLDMTRVEYSLMKDGSYQEPKAVSESPYADSNLQFADNGNTKIAVWQRQSKNLAFEPGQTATDDDLNAMMNASEICAAVYDEAGDSWMTKQLTENGMADMAPVVAANGKKAVAVWRRVASTTTQNVAAMEFDAGNDLLYSVWDGETWSEEKTIYNGTSGAIKGLSAAMDEEGNTIITYAIDSSSYVGKVEMAAFAAEQENQKLDVVYSIIDKENNLTNSTIFLTKDEYIDENPQVTAVMLDGQERFVAAWYTQRPLSEAQGDTAVSDIQLRVINSDGSLYNNFANSINEINNNASVTISNRFRFARTNSKDINDLALVWIAPELEHLEEVNPAEADMDRDSLYTLRFYQKSQGAPVYVSAAIPIVTVEENNKIDHADAYLTESGETICAVLQTTAYDLSNPDLQEHIELDEADVDGNPIVITIATPISAMKTATGEFINSAKIGDPIFDYASVRHDNTLPIQLTVTNQGVDPIDRVSVTTTDEKGGNEQKREFEDLNLMPNASTILTVYHPLADEGQLIQNISYSASITFDRETPETIAPITGLAEVQIPDVGINTIETVRENQHRRDIQVKLYNQSDIELEKLADQGYKAYIGFYSDNLCNTPASGISLISYEEIIAQAEQNTFEIPKDQMHLIDNGALICSFRYALPSNFENGDQALYAKVWVEKAGEEITEAYTANNAGSVVFTDPVARNNGNPILLTSELSADASGNTTAHITVKNLSWNAVPADSNGGGNLIATLIDSDGTPLETQQSLLTDGKLLTLEGEQEISKTFQFLKPGADVRLSYVQVSDEEADASLSELTIHGVTLKFDRDTKYYEVNAENLFHAEIEAIASNPNASITAKRVLPESADTLTSKEGVLSDKLALELGQSGATTENVIELTVTSVAGTEQKYTVKINNTSINHNKVTLEVPAFMNQAGEKTVGISLKDFEGAPVSFTTKTDGGEKEGPFAWLGGSRATAAVNVPDIEGEHSITIEVLDDHGFVTAATAKVLVDKTAPVIDEQSVRFEETDIPLFKNPFGMNMLLPSLPSETDGVTDHQLKIHLKASDELSGMERVTANAGGREYEAVKNGDGSYTAAITYSFRGPLVLTAYDRAGNSSETSRDVNIDDALPVGEFSTGAAVVTQTEAKLFASVGTRDEYLSECGIEYRKQTDAAWTQSVLSDLNQKEDFYVTVNPIESGAEYVYRVFVRDVIGNMHYGETKNFLAPSSDKTVNGFYVEGQLGESVIDNTAHTIAVTMLYHTDLEALREKLPYVTQFIVSKNAVAEMLSAETGDDTLYAIFRVTAENETSEEYTLTIQIQPAPEIDHSCFDSITNAAAGIHPTVILGNNLENARQIEVLLYDSNNLLVSRAVVQKRDEDYVANIPVPENTDIENAKVYTIAYIIDGIETLTEQTVTVERARNNQCELLEFRVQEAQSIDINPVAGTIHVMIPYDYTENSIQTKAVVSKDATYTINGAENGRLTVDGDSELKITSGTGEEKVYTVTVARAATPQVHLMTFQMQPYNKESRVAVKVTGTELVNAREIKVIATAQDDPNITVSAVANKSGTDTYMAMLTIPDNFKLFEDRVFKLSAEVDGIAQIGLDVSQKDIIQPKNNNVIESFTIENAASDAVITHNDNAAEGTIDIVMNYDADLTNLNPVIKLRDGAVLTPETTDFTNPVVYTLSGANQADRTYMVYVTKKEAPTVTGLSFTPFTSSKAGEITVTVEGGKIDSLRLPLVITASNGNDKIEGEVIQTDGVYSAELNIPENTEPRAARWKLTLTENGKEVPLPETILHVQPALNITAFVIPGQLSSSVDGNTINVVMPKGKDLTALIPEITFTPGAAITPALGTAVNFSEDVEYTLTLGSDTAAYKISVTTKSSGGGSIGGGGGGGGGGTTATYNVTFDTQGGSKIDTVKVARNNAVNEPETPARDGYTFAGWYMDKEGIVAYDFDTKVMKNITLYAKWIEDIKAPNETTTPTGPEEWGNPFTDVNKNDWYYGDVEYAAENGLFSGTTETTFEPNAAITRAMLVTVLWRNENQPVVNYLMSFEDVSQDAYYAEAIRWAASTGIVKGYSDTEFAPDQEISREQIAAILERYTEFKGMPTDERGDLTKFTDASEISEWAKGNMEWAVGAGLISGRDDGTVDPLGSAVRAEVAAMLHRFLEK